MQNVASGRESHMEGLKQQQVSVGWDMGLSGCGLGSAFLGESLGWLQHWRRPAAVERRQFPSSKTQWPGREDRFQEGTSACEKGMPKRCGWQQSSWPLLLIQIVWPRRILITAQLLSP